MTRYLKIVAALVVVFALVGVAMTYLGLPRGSLAATANSPSISGVSISPEELTRAAGAMPVQVIENYH